MFPWLKVDEVSADTLRSHKAKWHDSCRLQNKTKVKRAAKRKAAPAVCEGVPMKKYTHASVPPSVEIELSFFVNNPKKSQSPMHQASTFGLDARVRQCALQLQDQRLLTKHSAGDTIALEAKYHSQCVQQSQKMPRITPARQYNHESGYSTCRASHVY